MSPTGAPPPPPPPPPPPDHDAVTASTRAGRGRGGLWSRFRARSRRFQVISWVLVGVLVLSVIGALLPPEDAEPAVATQATTTTTTARPTTTTATTTTRPRTTTTLPTTTTARPPTTTSPPTTHHDAATERRRGEPSGAGPAGAAAGEGTGPEDRLRPGPVRPGMVGRRRRHLRPQRLRHPQRHAPRGPAAHRAEARHERLRGPQRCAPRSLHRPRHPLRPGPGERRRPDRPRGGPLRRLAEGRPAAQRRRAPELRQRPAQPAGHRRADQPAEERRRRRDLAPAEPVPPLHLRRPPGRREVRLPPLGHGGRARCHRPCTELLRHGVDPTADHRRAPPFVAPAPAPTPPPVAPPPAAPPPQILPIVHPGAFCAPAGATGVTNKGTPMVCRTSPTDSRNRWRSAG